MHKMPKLDDRNKVMRAVRDYGAKLREQDGVHTLNTLGTAYHTAGNVPMMDCNGKPVSEFVTASLQSQVNTAAADSLGLCVFGRSVTDTNTELVVSATNDAHGTELEPSFFEALGRETLKLEHEFNKAAGFSAEDDELPPFFYDESFSIVIPRSGCSSTLKTHESAQQDCRKIVGPPYNTFTTNNFSLALVAAT